MGAIVVVYRKVVDLHAYMALTSYVHRIIVSMKIKLVGMVTFNMLVYIFYILEDHCRRPLPRRFTLMMSFNSLGRPQCLVEVYQQLPRIRRYLGTYLTD